MLQLIIEHVSRKNKEVRISRTASGGWHVQIASKQGYLAGSIGAPEDRLTSILIDAILAFSETHEDILD